MVDKPAGYFAWMKGLRGPAPVKFGIERIGLGTSVKIRQGVSLHEDNLIKEWPLSAEEYALPLETLMIRYKCPQINSDDEP